MRNNMKYVRWPESDDLETVISGCRLPSQRNPSKEGVAVIHRLLGTRTMEEDKEERGYQ
jgi:hypothetical protein